MQIGALLSAATGCKTAIDKLKAIAKVPDQCEHVLSVCAACQPMLRLLARLQAREATHKFVDDACSVAASVFAQCEDAFANVPSDITAAESESAFAAWWNSAPPKKLASSASRMALLPEIQTRVTHVLGLLQLCLVAVQLEVVDVDARRGIQPVVFHSRPLDEARAIFHLFEMGRLKATEQRYPLCAAHLTRGSRDRGVYSVTLARTASSGYELQFDAETISEKTSFKLSLDGSLVGDTSGRLRRSMRSLEDMDQSPSLTSAVRYALGGDVTIDFIALADPWCVLPTYPRGGDERYVRVTVEVFELVLLLGSDMAVRGVKAVDALMGNDSGAAFQDRYRTAVTEWLAA